MLSSIHRSIAVLAAGLLLASAPATGHDEDEKPAPAARPAPPITRGAKHPSRTDATRFLTNRDAAPLPLPAEEDAFMFVVLGDRTGGPAEGVEVLAEAVGEINLLEPDLVMTVGDLIEGYNERDEWMTQMREYKGIMNDLLCPWFPVAGNHDVYWRGPNKPDGEHEQDYEMFFGPLWYAFAHKDCGFIVLYSDEGDPVTGEKAIGKASAQVMSDEQLAWVAEALARTGHLRHVFVFLHHPRWIGGNYGDDWERVHALLAAAGNVRAVFAGHIHYMRYDGVRDGIEYVTLATTGGGQSGKVPEAGYLHHFHTVTVRHEQIAMAALPVGEVMDVRAITDTVSRETGHLASLRPTLGAGVALTADGAADAAVEATITNPVSRPIEVTLVPTSPDSRWRFVPDHVHATLAPDETLAFSYRAVRPAAAIDETLGLPALDVRVDYLTPAARFAVPPRAFELPVTADLAAPPVPRTERALRLDGSDDYLAVRSDLVDAAEGPLTLEAWFNASRFDTQTGLVSKTENSEYGFALEGGLPRFYIFLGDAYTIASAGGAPLATNRWHHVAGVYDGHETRLYVNGRLAARVERSGPRRRNELPLLVGAEVDGRGAGSAHFEGAIDGVRLSSVARYDGTSFEPRRRHDPDAETLLLLDMDARIGPWLYDRSGRGAHPTVRGAPVIAESD